MVLFVKKIWRWFTTDFLGIAREMRWSYLPPLMVYLAAGVSSFTGIIESFFVKEQLGLSAAFLAGLAFWAGLPWALKMPLGHLVDLFWRRKAIFVYVGALFMAASLLIMVGLTGHKEWMSGFLRPDIWYVLASLLSPVGFVLQDVVADAMTVEAVHPYRDDGSPVPEKELQRMHVTMQTLGRIAIIGGSALVAGIGGWLATVLSYEYMYSLSLVIPVISVTGALLGSRNVRRLRAEYRRAGRPPEEIRRVLKEERSDLRPNWYILLGSAAFVLVSITLGLSDLPGKKEAIFFGSLITILYLMHLLLKDLAAEKRREILGIAVIIFVFRAVPSIGAGASWWQIDVLKFDEAFFGTLRQMSAVIAIIGMIALRGWMSRRPIPYLVVFLSIYSTLMMMPFIGMYYGLHEWTERVFGFGAKTIAIIDTMADSPLGQVSMIPMLAWIAREAPLHQKATYFAVMAAFTNLALSGSSLATGYLNEVFVVQRGAYQELGKLMIAAVLIGLVLPVATVLIVNRRTRHKSPMSSPAKEGSEGQEVVR
jgi:BT1 family